ncbi:hypothetical protein LRR80_02470 [Streptomyces sp. RO-S4]|nr:hypothetical protein [Streptomyces sp. RO-S4]
MEFAYRKYPEMSGWRLERKVIAVHSAAAPGPRMQSLRSPESARVPAVRRDSARSGHLSTITRRNTHGHGDDI